MGLGAAFAGLGAGLREQRLEEQEKEMKIRDSYAKILDSIVSDPSLAPETREYFLTSQQELYTGNKPPNLEKIITGGLDVTKQASLKKRQQEEQAAEQRNLQVAKFPGTMMGSNPLQAFRAPELPPYEEPTSIFPSSAQQLNNRMMELRALSGLQREEEMATGRANMNLGQEGLQWAVRNNMPAAVGPSGSLSVLPSPPSLKEQLMTVGDNVLLPTIGEDNRIEMQNLYQAPPDLPKPNFKQQVALDAFAQKAGIPVEQLTPQQQSQAINDMELKGMSNVLTELRMNMLNIQMDEKLRNLSGTMTPAQHSMAQGMHQDFMTESKDYLTMRDSRDQIIAASSTPNAMNDVAMVFSFMKVLDPTSTVREGEYATVENAKGTPAKIRNYYNRLVSGRRLDQTQIDDIVNFANTRLQVAEGRQKQRQRIYTNRAVAQKIPPAAVMYDLTEPIVDDATYQDLGFEEE